MRALCPMMDRRDPGQRRPLDREPGGLEPRRYQTDGVRQAEVGSFARIGSPRRGARCRPRPRVAPDRLAAEVQVVEEGERGRARPGRPSSSPRVRNPRLSDIPRSRSIRQSSRIVGAARKGGSSSAARAGPTARDESGTGGSRRRRCPRRDPQAIILLHTRQSTASKGAALARSRRNSIGRALDVARYWLMPGGVGLELRARRGRESLKRLRGRAPESDRPQEAIGLDEPLPENLRKSAGADPPLELHLPEAVAGVDVAQGEGRIRRCRARIVGIPNASVSIETRPRQSPDRPRNRSCRGKVEPTARAPGWRRRRRGRRGCDAPRASRRADGFPPRAAALISSSPRGGRRAGEGSARGDPAARRPRSRWGYRSGPA
jgi:hypothetical protein